jgi:hypothetical protein
MKTSTFGGAVVRVLGGVVLCVSAGLAMADIVRTSAGVLADGYVESYEFVGQPANVYISKVTYTPTSTVVCFSGSPFNYIICDNWFPGYTKTGNGLEVTKP